MIPYHENKYIFNWSFNINGFYMRDALPWYMIMLALGVIIGFYYVHKKLCKSGYSLKEQILIAFISSYFTLVGGRLFYLIFYTDLPWQKVLTGMFLISEEGLVSLGGFLFGIISMVIILKFLKKNILEFFDIVTPSLALGLFVGRIGCFLSGCCGGKVTTVPWGIVVDGVTRHATQIYSSFYGLVIFLFLYYLSQKKLGKGVVFASGLISYGVARFLVEFLRYNPIVALGLSLQQIGSLLMVVVGAGILAIILRKRT